MIRITITALVINVSFIPEAKAFNIAETISGKIGDKVRSALVKAGCKQIKRADLATVGEIGCEALDIGSKTEGTKQSLMNIVLMLSMVVSLINTKCAVTERGKKHLPKSYTANITHWIHKLAALVYLYADFQNTKKNLEIFQDLENLAASNESKQETVLEIQKNVMEELKASYEDKKGLINTAATALGAVAAVEAGMVGSMIAMGSWLSVSEGKTCALSKKSLISCASPSSPGLVASNKVGMLTMIKDQCVAYYKNINLAGSLIKTAREKAVQMAVSQVTSRVNNAVADQGNGTRIMTQATTNVLGGKASNYLNNQISETVNFLADKEGSKNLYNVVEDTKSAKCVTDAVEAKTDEWIKEGAAAAAVSAAAAIPGANGAAIAANCGLQGKLEYDRCRCSLRNIGGIKQGVAIYKQNLEMKEIKNKEIKEVPGVEDEKLICAVDYVNWGVRHDLNCVPLGSDEEKVKAQDTTAELSPDQIFKMLDQELKKIMSLDPYIISAFLNNGQNLRLIDYLSQGEHTEDYLMLSYEDKKGVDSAVSALGQAILKIQDIFIESAHASTVRVSNTEELWKELGINMAGMALVAALYHPVTEAITELHKTPFKRAILFLTSYSMASANIEQTDNTINDIDEDIKSIEDYIQDYKDETGYNFWQKLDYYFNPISTAHAAPKYWPTKERPRVCLQGSTLDPDCECLEGKGKCGYGISFNKDNELFSNPNILSLMKSHVGLVQAASVGKVTNQTVDKYKRDVAAISKNMDPHAANRNLNFITQSFKYGSFDLEKASRTLYEKLTGAPANHNWGFPKNSSDENESSGISQSETIIPRGRPQMQEDVQVANHPVRDHIQSSSQDGFNYEHADVKYKMDDIESNKRRDLFQQISSRYLKVISSGRLHSID